MEAQGTDLQEGYGGAFAGHDTAAEAVLQSGACLAEGRSDEGSLWAVSYTHLKNPIYLETARQSELVMDEILQKFVRLHHDMGFQFLHTAVADYRLTGDGAAKTRGLHAAGLLAGRFNPIGNFIRAWNDDLSLIHILYGISNCSPSVGKLADKEGSVNFPQLVGDLSGEELFSIPWAI